METFSFSIYDGDPKARRWERALFDSADQVGAKLLSSERQGTSSVYVFDRDISQALIAENMGQSGVFEIRSGAPRHEVRVRPHLRRRIVDHLEHAPSYCMCKRSKTMDRTRRKLIKVLK